MTTPYATIAPETTNANGVRTNKVPSNAFIPGAFPVNPAYAADFVSGQYYIEHPVPGDNTPNRAVPRAAGQAPLAGMRADAQTGAPAAFKDNLPGKMTPPIMGPAARQKPFTVPWVKKFIPPLPIYNDASQWVNTLLLNQAMTWFDAATSNPPLRAQYFTPPPIIVSNLAGGALNLQLQLGTTRNQIMQLTTDASNYFGGP